MLTRLRWLAVAAMMVAGLVAASAAMAQDWSRWSLGEARFEVPPGWRTTDRVGDTNIIFEDPGGRRLDVSWFKPEQPLTSFSDVVSHKRARIGGEGALVIFARTGPNESIQVAYDRKRPDGRQFIVIYAARGERLQRGSALLDAFLARIAFGPSAAPVASSVPIEAPVAIRSPPTIAADDLARDLGAGETQTVVLFDGAHHHPALLSYAAQAGNWSAHAKVTDAGLVVDGPAGDRFAIAGLYATEAIVWLDRFNAGAETVLSFRFDPARTTGFVAGVASTFNLPGNEPNNPRLLLHWRLMPDGTGAARIVRDYDAVANHIVAAKAPTELRLVLTPQGGRFVADGLPDTLVPWAPLTEGQGLRVYIYAQPELPQQPSRLALTRLTVTRTAGAPAATAPTTPAVSLPTAVLFAGAPSPSWTVTGLPGLDVATYARISAGALVVDIPDLPGRWPQIGLLSNAPAIVLDDRVDMARLETVLDVDPKRTSGLLVQYAWGKTAEMWGRDMAAAAGLMRARDGPFADRWVLWLRTGAGPYAVWTRPLDAGFVETRWNGRVILENGAGTMSARLDGGPTVAGTGFNIARGAKLYMTAYSAAAKEGIGARLALKRIAQRWLAPPDLSKLDRWRFVDDAGFDAKGYLADLAEAIDGATTAGGRP